MVKRELAKLGDQIPADSFHVSELSVRAGHPFGETEEDKALIDQSRRGKIIGPFKDRRERGGYGVAVGRSRYLAKKEIGAKFLCIFERTEKN